MKKTFALLVSALFVFGMVGSAFAIHAEIPAETQAAVVKGSTQITLSGQIRLRARSNNNFDFDDDNSDQANWYMTRLRLGSHIKVSDMAEAMIQLEHESGSGGENITWGSNNSHLGEGVGILQGWVLIKGDIAAGAGLKAGHMPLALGYKTFFDHTLYGDDAIVVFVNPNGQTHIAGLTVKFDEGSVGDNTDDLDGYVLLGTFKVNDNLNVGANWTYLTSTDLRDAAGDSLSLHNVEVHADGKFGMVAFKASADFQFGDAGALGDGGDAEGYAVYGQAAADLGGAKVRVTAAYGTGEEGDADTQAFLNFPSATMYTTFVDDYRMGGAGGSGRGITNNLYVGIGADANVTDKLSVKGDLWYIALAEDNPATNDDTVGWEIDAKATYKVTRNVQAWIHGGYLVADDGVGVADPDNAWATQGGLILSW